jgi:hypothetical protein
VRKVDSEQCQGDQQSDGSDGDADHDAWMTHFA